MHAIVDPTYIFKNLKFLLFPQEQTFPIYVIEVDGLKTIFHFYMMKFTVRAIPIIEVMFYYHLLIIRFALYSSHCPRLLIKFL